MYHFVYLSFENAPNGRNYIGKRSTPTVYDGYFGSFKDDTFAPDNRIVLGYYQTAEAAIQAEIQFQRVFNVVEDDTYANRSYQTSTGFVSNHPKTKEKISRSRKGQRLSEELKKQISERQKGSGNSNYGKKTSEEAKQKMREKLTGRKLPPEVGKKIGEANRRRVITEETRKKLSEAAKLREAKKRETNVK
jgi:hypothetical protein